jgi:uncharacterized membrane protein
MLAAALAGIPPARAGGVRYDLQMLPAAPGMLQSVTGLNDSGVVVGEQRMPLGSARPFSFDAGVLSALPIPGLLSARPTGISANGVVVGIGVVDGRYQAVFLGAGFAPIAGLPAGGPTQSSAQAIDPAGRMVARLQLRHQHPQLDPRRRPDRRHPADGLSRRHQPGGPGGWCRG